MNLKNSDSLKVVRWEHLVYKILSGYKKEMHL